MNVESMDVIFLAVFGFFLMLKDSSKIHYILNLIHRLYCKNISIITFLKETWFQNILKKNDSRYMCNGRVIHAYNMICKIGFTSGVGLTIIGLML